ncbi:MAG: nitrate ABC transporter ATP-binding protein [Gloeomargarita sp. SKYG116]|nr:nitrate ABC transporter ATP-binding protein [Gloeomargarita sp. SKYG116]MCS7226665.1 nitrate ABC transporter ATP-binding protein [Gloeomargarita sp. SKYB31]MDW8400133.1 nitrate ABC transporter ATP-binding protein [Gloeomargarita sp. SKYGB_i_bin116]
MVTTTRLATAAPTATEEILTFHQVTKQYGELLVLNGINLSVRQGEFICIIGHSGCGKSTLLNLAAGFTQPTSGEVRLRGQVITKPGPDRMVVFQNYSLLPWLTVFENVFLAVDAVYPQKRLPEKRAMVREYLNLVGLGEAMDKRPPQISGGMKQRVAIARALAVQPEVLLLDEPFGALDAITKEELQEELLAIWSRSGCTVLMITHDIDEALFLADRVIMMTNGPAARIGDILAIPFERPRSRERLLEDPSYYDLRNQALEFLYERFAHPAD